MLIFFAESAGQVFFCLLAGILQLLISIHLFCLPKALLVVTLVVVGVAVSRRRLEPAAVAILRSRTSALVAQNMRFPFSAIDALNFSLLCVDSPVSVQRAALVEKFVEIEGLEDVLGFGLFALFLLIPSRLIPVSVRPLVLLPFGRTNSITHLSGVVARGRVVNLFQI